MTEKSATHAPDPDSGKGAVEGDKPTDEQAGNPQGDGVDANGLPNDPVATAQDGLARTRTRARGRAARERWNLQLGIYEAIENQGSGNSPIPDSRFLIPNSAIPNSGITAALP